MKTIEASGKTVEEALSAGLKQLGLDLSQVTHEVIDRGSPGLFGMFGRLAKVKISVREEEKPEEDFGIDMPVISLEPEKKPQAAKPAEKPTEPTEEKPAPQKTKSRSRKEKKAKAENKPAADTETAIMEDEAPVALTPVREFPELELDKLGENGKKAYEFISQLTKLMGVQAEIRILEEENQVFVDINGDTLGVMIGRRGETLDAAQYLTSLYVNRDKNEYTRLTLDVEHYRAKREETLVKLANRMANRARKSGRRVVLEPMNPYERRVLHSALQQNPYVTTHSEGEDPYRRVIITLK
ncbi:MAG: Jag N-terminal domain-containing protein [Clostridiales bacterium]|nr:Jag N-terminal domain-containing protein [Clostridiales bacterium]